MCGIGGIITNNPKELIFRFMESVNHRGPDNSSIYLYENLVLGHNRLSIIDLSESGNQPMSYKGRYVITYNGEIFNYIELRSELSELGYKFETGTDTEIILASYDRWGKDCLHKFNGMWSFALLDKEKGTLFCSRDRYGIKPFYYYEKNNVFAFGSEIKQFTTLPGWKAELNIEKALDFLSFDLTDHDEYSLFKNVSNLKGGHNLHYDLHKRNYKIEKWYNLEEITKKTLIDEDSAVESLEFLLRDSINLRLRSDVNVGSCLSGGLDSSSIVCHISELLEGNSRKKFKTYSACSHDKRFDEQEYIDKVIQKTKFESIKLFPSFDGFLENMNKVIWHQDEPFSSTSIFAQWSLFEEARKNETIVVLDGQGSDEVFAGYNNFFPPYIFNEVRKLHLLKALNEIIHYKRHKNLSISNILKGFLGYKNIHSIKRVLNKDSFFWLKNEHREHYISIIKERRTRSIRDESYKQLLITNLPKLLRYEDRNSMAFSIEARVPFLDHRIVEFGCALNDRMKIKKGVDKSVLRESVKGILPHEIYSRMEKLGFVTPEKVWFFNNYSKIKDKLNETTNLSKELVNTNIINYSDEIYAGKRNYDQTVWKILIFGEWLKTFNVYVK